MSQSCHLKRVLIVGGGTAGWLAAFYLNRILRHLGCRISLVESAELGTIGVGEATVPTLVDMIRSFRLDEGELMRRTSATFKLAIRFEGWTGDGHDYWHPFGGCGLLHGLDLYHHWLRHRQRAPDDSSYSDYALQAQLAGAGKGPSSSTLQNGAYAYHLDAIAFANYLRDLAVAEGVVPMVGTIRDASMTPDGDIASVHVDDGRSLEADLFIDASGFGGTLIERTLGDPWIDWSNLLLCDRALAMPLPIDEDPPSFTRSIAMPAGWCWRIPLKSRTGSGYVYSSRHTSDEQAVRDLVSRLDLQGRRLAEPRLLRMRIGRRTLFWKNNCVSLGLASGFVEPLESTGIHLTQRAIMLLVDHLPQMRMQSALRDAFNRRMGEAFAEVRDFILLHYRAATREEPFWRDARSVALPARVEDLLALYDACGMIHHRPGLFTESSYHFILAGSGRLPKRPMATAEAIDFERVAAAMRNHRAKVGADVARTKSHAAVIAALHRAAGATAPRETPPSHTVTVRLTPAVV